MESAGTVDEPLAYGSGGSFDTRVNSELFEYGLHVVPGRVDADEERFGDGTIRTTLPEQLEDFVFSS